MSNSRAHLLVDFVNEKDTLGSSIEYSCDWVKSFLATAVPDLHLNKAFFIHVCCNRSEFGTNCNFMFFAKGVLADSLYYARFPNAWVTNQYHLESSIKFDCGKLRSWVLVDFARVAMIRRQILKTTVHECWSLWKNFLLTVLYGIH